MICLWKKCFECLEALISYENASINSFDFNFFYAVSIFRKPFYKESRKDIIENTLKYIKRIVINKNDIYFKVPSGLPLFLEFLCNIDIKKTQKLIIKFENMLKNPLNLNYAVKYGIINIFLYHFETFNFSNI